MTIIRMADVRAALDDAGYEDLDHEEGQGVELGMTLLGIDRDLWEEGSAEGDDDEA